MQQRPAGVIPPMTTPFHKNGEMDLGKVAPQVEWLIGAGAHGLAAGGSTGEGHTLDYGEYRDLIAATVDYVKQRTQFGRPIGSYQAVSHPLASAYTELELARSLAWWAAWCVAEDDPQAALAAAAAGAEAAEAAVATCERAIQAHGGIGFTWEHVLHRLYKRALWIRSWEASPAQLRAEVASELLERGGT